MSFGFWLKGPFEEPFLRIELGSGSYAATTGACQRSFPS